MKSTLSLVAAPATVIRWQVGDRVTVVLSEDEPRVARPYRVIYADPQHVSLEAVA